MEKCLYYITNLNYHESSNLFSKGVQSHHGNVSRHCSSIRTVQSINRTNGRDVDMKLKIKFVNRWLKVIYVTKEVSDQAHLDNYISYMEAKYGYECDEVWTIKN